MTPATTLLWTALVFPGGITAIGLALLLKAADRKLIARLQARVGPPMMQPVYDLAKLLCKETLVPREATTALFLGAPIVGFACAMLAASLIPIPGLASATGFGGDVLVLLYLLAVPGIAVMVAGSSSGSVYGAVGFSREMSLVLAYEGPLIFAVVTVAVYVGRAEGAAVALSLPEIVAHQRAHGANLFQPLLWPALLAYLACLPAALGVAPFDIAEAETEVLEGPLLEYSGPPLALMHLMQAVQRLVVIALGIVLFFPVGPDGILGFVLFVAEIVLVASLALTLLRASMGRMRIDQALIFFFTWPEALGLAGLALVVRFV